MKITYKSSVTVEGLNLFRDIQAALVSIHRIFFLLLTLNRGELACRELANPSSSCYAVNVIKQ